MATKINFLYEVKVKFPDGIEKVCSYQTKASAAKAMANWTRSGYESWIEKVADYTYR